MMIRIQEIPDFPAADTIAFGALSEAHSRWIPQGPWQGAIVWGLPLPGDVIAELRNGPTKQYAQTYREWNRCLDKIAQEASHIFENHGIRAHPIAASRVVDDEHKRGEASHRHLAASFGMGWIGKHGLLVTPRWGAAVRLVTVLVDEPIEPSPKLSCGGCATCSECVDACPVDALDPPINARKLTRCWKLLKEYERDPAVGQPVCGICIKVCHDRISLLRSRGDQKEVIVS